MNFRYTMNVRLGLALLATALLALPVAAQEGDVEEPAAEAAAEPQPAPQQPPTCDDEAYRQFDFWVGEWTVYPWSGREIENPPTNHIEIILGGCGLRETFSMPGYGGTSITFYDRYDQRWHQTWLASDGDPLYLVGGWEDGKMVLADDPQDERPKSRITWQPLDEGQVRQTWELSRDGGETWQKVFDGRYVPTDGGM